ncbi:hypothetical protein C4553_00480 [Candidatus Parcubacteria bacterium]|nr:MAG: hypothetical protein C4553_00480 [Candidatus Parcubacteria bacterium]
MPALRNLGKKEKGQFGLAFFYLVEMGGVAYNSHQLPLARSQARLAVWLACRSPNIAPAFNSARE